MTRKKTLIIVPAYNERDSIGGLIDEIRAKCPFADIAVINDQSTDDTESEALKHHAPVATLPYNLGIGGAVQTGYQIALHGGYDVAVQVDGDGQHDPSFIPALIQPILDNQCDFVIGSRFLPGSAGFQSTLARRTGIRFFTRLLGALTGQYVSDPTSGFRAAGLKLIALFADYYPADFPEPEALKMACRYKMRIREIPVTMRERQAGQSSIRYLKTFYYMLKVTLAILLDTFKQNK